MFYMGGMTLGYFSPHPAEACENEPADVKPVAALASKRKSLLDLLKPVVDQTPRKQPQAWPIHVFY